MLIHWIWLSMRPGITDRDKAGLLRHFHDPEEIYFASPESFSRVEGMEQEALDALLDKDLLPAEDVLAECARKKIRILTWQDAAYPASLKNIVDPPLVLYYKGQLPDFDQIPVIGIVGTRKASLYGMNTAKQMGYQIARCGAAVVSGMATGIDAMAMKGALTGESAVIGVLGCGVDVVYPVSNRALYEDMVQHGCLISEFLPGTPPYKWNFPKRNRIISGLSNGVLVVEAPERSGSLITARQAAEQGRDVFVVPGNIDVPTFVGSNALLRDGAIAVSSGWDVVSEYRHLYPARIVRFTTAARQRVSDAEMQAEENQTAKVAQKPKLPEKKQPPQPKKDKKDIDNAETTAYIDTKQNEVQLSPEEQLIMDQLAGKEQLVDDVIAGTGLPAGKVLAALTMLQVKGAVKSLPGRRVAPVKQNR